MNYMTVVSDLDGTLLNSKGKVTKYTKDIIKKLIDKGINFFIATGRHHKDALQFKEELGLDTYLISSNGARVHDDKGNTIFKHDLEQNLVAEILEDFKDVENIQRNLYTEDEWITDKLSKTAEEFSKSSGFPYKIESLDKMKKNSAIKLFFMSDDHDNLVDIEKKILDKYENRVNVMFSLPICLEITPHGISKGKAIEEIFKKEGLKRKEALAFGDGFNDYEMLKTVGKGLVMENAHYKLKNELPKHQVIKTNDENGLALYLDNFFFK